MSGHTVEIDWTRCAGHGLCAELVPDRIASDEWGFPVIAPTAVRRGEQRDVRRAISVCPTLALRLGTPRSKGPTR
jgi:ferredoxin